MDNSFRLILIMFRFLFALFIIFGLFQPAYSKEDYEINELLTVYVSTSEGNDSNDGLTKDKPLKTIRKAIQKNKSNIRLRLKCGDVFFECISNMSNSIVESYGKGNKPVLCGFKILRRPGAWQTDTLKGVWKLDLTRKENFIGFSAENALEPLFINDIGCLYNCKEDKIYGHLVKDKNQLAKNGDFFTSATFGRKDTSFKYLYFKWKSAPEELGCICLSTFNHGISFMTNCIIRNIAIVGFARHGICGISNTKIENCAIDIIGGSIQIGHQSWARYGNGIECGFSKYKTKDITVSNCRISRTYDCGVTIQGTVVNDNNPCRIRFINNKFIYCRQAFEHWITNKNGTEPDYIDCEFSKNICYMMGENQFDSPETRDANILSYEKTNKSLKISDNIFYGASYYCGYAFASVKNNRVYIYKGQYLNTYHGKKDYPTIYANDSSDIETYRQLTQDNSRIFILEKGSKEDMCFRKKILKKISYKPRNILLEISEIQ